MINELFIVKRCTESQSENFARLVRFYNPQILYRTEYKKKKKNMQVLNRKKGTKNKKKTRNTGVAPSAMLERNYLNRYLYRPPPPPLMNAWSIHPFEIDFWATVIKMLGDFSTSRWGTPPPIDRPPHFQKLSCCFCFYFLISPASRDFYTHVQHVEASTGDSLTSTITAVARTRWEWGTSNKWDE